MAEVPMGHLQHDEVTRQPGAMVQAVFAARKEAAHRVATLTAREHEILVLVLAGCSNKIIAWKVGISQRTVETHRATIMKKTGSESIPALARLAVAADWNGIDGPIIQSSARGALAAD
jgi:two-component system CheB/CheR fusion protein